jgi:selenocysteine-specific elongation factor
MTDGPLHVVATAGHVDHGKSSLIVRLTGIDPDRWEEEKRRGLTIDLGFAWCTLPSGREVGFVDVPGHERFVRNMLAGVGPVRLILFVVAADEGWKPQSEEHLSIVDVLGARAGVVALTKRDLVDPDTLALREAEVRERLGGTALAGSPIVACSSTTGEGLEELRAALDEMVASSPPPEDRGRPRINIDRAFTIRGAGTVVTGTLTGGALAVGEEVVIHPSGASARIRSLQTHRRPVQVASPVSRVAANLAATTKDEVQRGDVLTRAGQWRPTSAIEVSLRAVRAVVHPITARGAYKLYAGSAERDAELRLYGGAELRPGDEAFAHFRLARPIVVDWGDRFVLREAGRRETVAGGMILDPHAAVRPDRGDPIERLARRAAASPDRLPSIIVEERGAVRAGHLPVLAGSAPDRIVGASRAGAWWVSDRTYRDLSRWAVGILEEYHREHPLRPGMEQTELQRMLQQEGEAPVDAILERLREDRVIARGGTTVRLAGHQVSLGQLEPEAAKLVELVAAGEPTPPTVKELEASGFSRELVEACATTGRLARVSPDLVFTPGFLARAEEVARAEAGRAEGLTVSRFRELIETSRKYALPILESLDRRGLTRREGDVRRPGAQPEASGATSTNRER